MFEQLILLLTAAAISPGRAGVAMEFHVTPTFPVTQPCPLPCHTLDQYAQDPSIFSAYTSIDLIFLSGEHSLTHDLSLGSDEVSLQRSEAASYTENRAVICYRSEVRIQFKVSKYITICNITLRSELNQVQRFEIIGPMSNLILLRLNLDKIYLVIQEAYAIHIDECLGNRSTLKFIDANNINVTHTKLSGISSSVVRTLDFANRILIELIGRDDNSIITSLSVHKCQFTNYSCGIYSMTKKLKVFISKAQFKNNVFGIYTTHSQEITLVHTKLEQNVYGVYIGSLGQSLRRPRITIENTQVINNQYGVFFQNSRNSAISILNCTISKSVNFGLLLRNTNSLSVMNSFITENRLGIVSIGSTLNLQSTFVCNNTVGMVIPPGNMFMHNAKNGNNSIQNCNFLSNNLCGLTLINSKGKTEISNSNFSGNKGTPIIAYQSTFELMGDTVFQDNMADRGGGLALYNSTVTFGPGSNTQFINNTALEYGGAIYVVSLPTILPAILINFENIKDLLTKNIVRNNTLLRQNCFYKNATEDFCVTFIDNTATLGGESIYGPTLYTSTCSVTRDRFVFIDNALQSVPETLQVSSDPSRVCFCVNGTPTCEVLWFNKTKYPGERFFVPAILTGYNFGRVAGSLYTNVMGQNYTNVIDESQHVQATSTHCTKLKLTVLSHNHKDCSFMLTLTAHNQFVPQKLAFEKSIKSFYSAACSKNQPCTARFNTPVYINVTLRDCPLGFKLKEASGKCECDETLANLKSDDTHVTCKIKKQTGYITRRGTTWIGVDTRQNITDIYYWHKKCPRDYCNLSSISIDPKKPDTQCNGNRNGILCGGCRSNYSLQLGNNKCLQCGDNDTLALLVVFAFLGILLVMFISILDLTVASGTINGLIFFANAVWRNNAILFTFKDRKSIGFYIITVPIAWINMDFGIETCFSQNMDQLTKTGLQFVFPVYIWCIAGFIIIISHYSTRATKLFGNNSVAVLATLFLLSYGKLFRNITDVFTYADVKDSNHTIRKVWALDGNVSYEDPRHIALLVVALAFFLLFSLPFTLTLLLVPFLRAKSNLRLLCWINKLQPFFDTYYGPFKLKRKYQAWTGILLFCRVIIVVVFAITSTTYPYANILLMTVIATLLSVYSALMGLLYKRWYLSFLELLYLLNLITLGEAFLFFRQDYFDSSDFNPVPVCSLCVALFQFAGTLIFHVLKRIKGIRKVRVLLEEMQNQATVITTEGTEPTVHVLDTDQGCACNSSSLRESLLSDGSQLSTRKP